MNKAERIAAVVAGFRTLGFEPMMALAVPGGASRIAGNRFVATHVSVREKLGKGSLRATVGAITTCLYRVEERKAKGFETWKTSVLAEDFGPAAAAVAAGEGDCP